MFVWKLCQELPSDKTFEWDALAEKILGPQVHPGRRRGFQLAREALRLCLADIGVKKKISEIILEQHSRLIGEENLLLSLSHTSEGGAAVLGQASKYQSLGIDLELKSRPVRSEVLGRISHPEDMQMHRIHLWTLKEAIFKACMNTHKFEHPIEFSSIRVNPNTWQQASGLTGEWQIHEQQDYVIAIAAILRRPQIG